MKLSPLSELVWIRGGGDLASGVALRLHRCGFRILISELPQPLALRRCVSFAEAVYSGTANVEECTGCRVADPGDAVLAREIMDAGQVPVLIDPEGEAISRFRPEVVV